MKPLVNIAMILSISFTSPLVASGETTTVDNWKTDANSPKTDWNPRSLSYAELHSLAFYAPKTLPAGFAQQNARVAWVVKDSALPQAPARRAVWIRYEDANGHWFEMIEARHIPGFGLLDNVDFILGAGYFRKELPIPSQIVMRTTRKTDFLLLSPSLKVKQLEAIVASSCPGPNADAVDLTTGISAPQNATQRPD